MTEFSLGYGKHTRRGRRVAVEKTPPEGYLGRHAADVKGLCSDPRCLYQCKCCGWHLCQCPKEDHACTD